MPKEQSPVKPTMRRYSSEEKAAAVRMVRALRAELGEPEPSYLRDRRAAEREAHERGTTISERKAWAAAAAMSRQRIVAKYANG